MPSFDIVSEISGHEIRNAVENANRELTNRWDFRNVQAAIEFNEKNESIKVSSESDFQVEQLIDILRNACIKRNIESTWKSDSLLTLMLSQFIWAGSHLVQEIRKGKNGAETDMAKKITKLIKDSKIKVQSQIQGEQVRVTGKSRDDLQAVIQLVKTAELGQPFQFNNFRD